jgi:uncharacterized membrane protein YdbT with pleckstrin-like domain
MTSYVQKVLQPGESVLHQAKLSWVMYLPGLFVLIGAGVVFGLSRAIFGAVWWADIVSLIIAAIGLYLVAAEWFERWTTEIAITDRRVIFKRGFIRRDTIEMSLEKVESVDVNQSLLGRLFDYGNVTIRGTGTGFAPLRSIDSPLEFRSHVTGMPTKPAESADPAPAQPEHKEPT